MALTHGIASGPANAVYAGGSDEKTEMISGSSAITPGMMLITNATDGTVDGAGNAAVNVIGVAAENSYQGVESYLTAFATTGDKAQIPIYYSKNLRFYGLSKAGSAALVMGDLLKTAATGLLEKFAAGTDATEKAVARYIGQADFTPDATLNVPLLCERVI